jgi:hypothetical protein
MPSIRTIALAAALAAAALAPAAAQARHGADDNPAARDDRGGQRVATGLAKNATEKRVAGTCSRNSRAKLKVKPDDGRLETEFEVDQNRAGVRWTVTLRRNGRLATSTHATTTARSGSFSVERRLLNGSGPDRISARAKSPSGEVCTAALTY